MIHVVTGAPCSGKTTYVHEHAKAGDIIIDFDAIATALGAEPYEAEGNIFTAAVKARLAAIDAALTCDGDSWIIDTIHDSKYQENEDLIVLDPGREVCIERAQEAGRPQRTFDGISKWYEGRKGNQMNIKTKTFDIKADNGMITGYASTWTREPDSYGDIVAKGAFADCIENLKAEGKVLPLLFNHSSDDIDAYIGTVTNLEEDDHGLKFDAVFDDTKEAQRARELAATGRLVKFSFAYDILDQGEVVLEDGRKANELRKLNIHEVSLVLYPANPDTSVVSVKSGRRNSAKDEDKLRQIIALAQDLLGDEVIEQPVEELTAKSEERDTVNDEERERIEALLKEADNLISTKEGTE